LGIAMESGSEATRNVADIVLLDDSFAVLPEAFQEGQRILNGMQDILRLYMTRILCLAVLIGAIGYASDGFPISPRQNAIVGFITMSIPAFALALWAKPGQSPKVSLTRRLAHFVIPAVLSICIVGFALYIFTLIQSSDEYYARTMLTYFTVICGIILLIFVEPPTTWWAGGDVLSGDWRPTYLAIGLLFLFAFCLVVPAAREFYGLTPLRQTSHYVLIVLATIIWIFGLRIVWRRRLVERYLNMEHF
jgi:cation-transporting ATPase E